MDIAQIHGTVVVLDDVGLLILGPPGSGKSSLAFSLLDEAPTRQRFCRLVADDQVSLVRRGQTILAHPAPQIEGLLEIRGIGIAKCQTLASAAIKLIVRFDQDPPRLPDPDQTFMKILGVSIPSLWLHSQSQNPADRIFGFLDIAGWQDLNQIPGSASELRK